MSITVLMVCTGNICRSIMAEVVLAAQLADAGYGAERVRVDSAGVSSEEAGNRMDRRAAAALAKAGYPASAHRARQITAADLRTADLILAMTHGHYQAIERLAAREGISLANGGGDNWGGRRLQMYRDFDPQAGESDLDVPDPWYGTAADFAITLATVERVSPALVEVLQAELDPARLADNASLSAPACLAGPEMARTDQEA